MVNNKNTNNEKEKKAGRPKGSKSKLNLPARNIDEAVNWTREIHSQANNNEFHSDDVVKYLNIGKGFTSPALSVLDKFGFIEKGSFGWKISELGIRAINGDKSAIREALERVDIFRDLLRSFGDKNVTTGVILSYLKTKGKKGENNNQLISDKYTKALEYLNSINETKNKSSFNDGKRETQIFQDKNFITLLKIKYAFHPLDENAKKELVEELYQEFKDNSDPLINSLINQIKENKDKKEVLQVLLNTLIDSFSNTYPLLSSKEKKPQKQRQEVSDNIQ